MIDYILLELESMNNTIDPRDYMAFLELLVDDLKNTDAVIGLGAGRMGYSLRAFIMRLCHMGFNASMIGDTNVPRVRQGTVVIVNSSSGETPSMILYAQQARAEGGTLYVITTNPDSTLAKMADALLIYGENFNTTQIMKTVYEQFTYLLLDKLAEDVVHDADIIKDYMIHNHSILE